MDQTNFQNNSLIFQNNYNKFSFNTIFQTWYIKLYISFDSMERRQTYDGYASLLLGHSWIFRHFRGFTILYRFIFWCFENLFCQ